MSYKKSHRDQKVRPYVYKAILEGCTILEIDIQSACREIVLGHNWRPKLPILFDCTLEEYLERLPVNKEVFVQLDIKEICFTEISRVKFATTVIKVLEPYISRVTFLISANEGLYREITMDYLYKMMGIKGFKVFQWKQWSAGELIETLDFWS